MDASVRVRNLTKRYAGTTAVAGVSFDAPAGQIFGLLGPNGAGKTTTLECLLGLVRPDGGTIHIGSLDLATDRRHARRLIGAQLQSTALQDKLTPREALRLFGSFHDASLKAVDLLSRFGLLEKADAAFDTLSIGQRQRLGLAIAFVNDPRVLVLDEPTAGLDPQSRRDLHTAIRALRDDGRTVILSTHYVEEAHQLCDQVAIIDHGQVVAAGPPAELVAATMRPTIVRLRTHPALAERSIRAATADVAVTALNAHDDGWHIATQDVGRCVIALVHTVEAEGVELLDLEVHRPSLEDRFIELTGRPLAAAT